MKRVSKFYLGLVVLVMGFGLMLQSCGGASADKVAAEFNQGCPKVISDGCILEKVAAEGNTIAFYYDYRGVAIQKAQVEYAASQSTTSEVLADIINDGKLDLFANNDLSYKLVIKCTDGTFDQYIPCDEIKAVANNAQSDSGSSDVKRAGTENDIYMRDSESISQYVSRLTPLLPITYEDGRFTLEKITFDGERVMLTYGDLTNEDQTLYDSDKEEFEWQYRVFTLQGNNPNFYKALKRDNIAFSAMFGMGNAIIFYYPAMHFK